MSKNVKMQVFVTPQFYISLVDLAKRNEIQVRSDSELIQKMLMFYKNKADEQQMEINRMQERIIALNRVIQEKEAVIHKALTKRKVKK